MAALRNIASKLGPFLAHYGNGLASLGGNLIALVMLAVGCWWLSPPLGLIAPASVLLFWTTIEYITPILARGAKDA